MRHGDYLHRRTNGIFVARLRVPSPLREVYGRADLYQSLHTVNYAIARLKVLSVVLGWKTQFQQQLEAMSKVEIGKLTTGNPLLLTGGLIKLSSASELIGLGIDEMLLQARKRHCKLCLVADGWIGVDIQRSELVNDTPESSLFVVDIGAALAGRLQRPVFNTLFVREDSLRFIKDGILSDCVFFYDAAMTQSFVCDLPGVSVPMGDLLISASDAESIRHGLASVVTPEMVAQSKMEAATATTAEIGETVEQAIKKSLMGEAYAHTGVRASAMLKEFCSARSWAPATLEQNARMCSVFVELMDDPTLGEINFQLIAEYQRRLAKLPSDLRNAKINFKTNSLHQLTALAVEHKLSTMPLNRTSRYVMKIGEAFAFAVSKHYMMNNPAEKAVAKRKSTHKSQDARDVFSADTLCRIFSMDWFKNGRGMRTARGKHYSFSPFHYWLPLLALYTGARLNELAQLYLKDVVCTDAGTWFLDFNLEGEEKIDEPDKRLKTINSIRIVSVCPELIGLGFVNYVQALKEAGYSRLFPELKRDPIKGFGKYAGSWFNERFLGEQLEIERDGTQCFHSFRHTFLSAMPKTVPDRIRNEISGHTRGPGIADRVYIKDEKADELAKYVNLVNFQRPTVGAFDVADGLAAVRAALQRKDDLSRTKARKH